MSKHTPGPWKVGKTKKGNKWVFYITNEVGENIVDAGCVYGNDAEFIVRACNNHDELLEACKKMVGAIESSEKGWNGINLFQEDIQLVIDKAEGR